MEHSNAVKIPCPSYHLTSAVCPSNTEQCKAAAQLLFCALVSKCMYLTNCTRPDISYAICQLAKFMSNYGTKHYEAAKHLLQYLQGMQSPGLTYGNITNPANLMTKPLHHMIHLKWMTHISMDKDLGPKSAQITRGC